MLIQPFKTARLRFVLVLLGIGAVAALTLAAVWWSGETARVQTLEAQRARIGASLELRANGVAYDLAQLRRDALLLAAIPQVGASHAAAGQLRFDQPAWHDHFEAVLLTYMRANPEMSQASLVDTSGRVLVRVNHDQGAMPASASAPASALVRRAAALRPGTVVLSEVTVAAPQGTGPQRQVIGAATPVVDGDGRPIGVLLLDVDIGAMLARTRISLAREFDLYLMDGSGAYLLHPAPRRTRTSRWQDEHVALAGSQAGPMQTQRGPGGLEYTSSVAIPLNPGQTGQDMQMTIALRASTLAGNVALARRNALLSLAGGILLAGCIVLLYRRLHRRAESERNERAALVASSYDAIIGKTLAGVVTSWNGGAERVFGFSAAEACGRSLADLIVPDDQRADETMILARVGKGEVVASFETTRRRKDGSMVDVSVTVSPIRSAQGQVVGAVKTVRDISAEKASAAHIIELNRSLERQVVERTAQIHDLAALHQAILANAAYAIVATDTAGRITVLNPAAERLSGYTAGELVGQTLVSSLHDGGEIEARAAVLTEQLGVPVAPGFDVFSARALRGLPNEDEWTCVCRDGRRVPVLVSYTALKRSDGELIGFLGIAADLSERKAAQRVLETRTHEAEAANRAKSAFLANMSHEIRTPMNAVLGMLQLLDRSDLPPRQADYTTKAKAAARTLLGILNDILDFSRVEAGKLTLETRLFSVEQLLGETASIMHANLNGKQLALRFDLDPALPPQLLGDPLRLQQILINLAGNAIKFTERGEVVVACRILGAGPDGVRVGFSVSDTGIGIAPEHCRTIFDGFAQAEASTARRYGGSGLGLAISQRLVRLMGGELGVTSAPGLGSKFHFALDCPLPAIQASALPVPVRARRAGPGGRALAGLQLLVVEDNPINQQVAYELLCAEGASVLLAGGGYAALELLGGAIRFDAVLMDVQMPDLDGYATTALLRDLPGLTQLPVIAVTANAMASDRAAALAAGMDDHVGKPFNMAELVDVILHHTAGAPRPPAAAPPSAGQPVFDAEAALARFGGSRTIFRSILGRWPASLDDIPARLVLADHGLAEVRACLHGLKGLAATVGAERLAAIASHAEKLVVAQVAPEVARSALAAVIAALGPARAAALQWLHENDSARVTPAPAGAPHATLAAGLAALLPLLASANMAALAQCEQLEVQHAEPVPGPLHALCETIRQLEFPAARAACALLLEQLEQCE